MATAEQTPGRRKREYHMRDIPTVPNAISATGLGLVAAGAQKFDAATKENDKAGQIIGALMILGGRTGDLADGLAARRLQLLLRMPSMLARPSIMVSQMMKPSVRQNQASSVWQQII